MSPAQRKRFMARAIPYMMAKAAKAEKLGLNVDGIELDYLDAEIYLAEALREQALETQPNS